MQLKAEQLEEIYKNLDFGEIQAIANQLGDVNRLYVRNQLTTLRDSYDDRVINAALDRIKARGIELKTITEDVNGCTQ